RGGVIAQEAVVFALRFGEAVPALRVRGVDLRPRRGEEDLPVIGVIGEEFEPEAGAFENAQPREGIEQSPVKEGPAGIAGGSRIVGLRYSDDAGDESADIGPGQGGATLGLFLLNDPAAGLWHGG